MTVRSGKMTKVERNIKTEVGAVATTAAADDEDNDVEEDEDKWIK